MSIRLKLLLIVLISIVALLATQYFLATVRLKAHLQARQAEWVDILAEGISENLIEEIYEGHTVKVRQILQHLADRDSAIEYLYVTDFDNNIFTHSFHHGFPRYLAEHFRSSTAFSDFGLNLQFDAGRDKFCFNCAIN